MNLSSISSYSPLQPISESPDARIDQLERQTDMLSAGMSEAERAAYKIRVRREISQMRQTIAHLRAQGYGSAAINNVIDRLTQKFLESINSFHEANVKFVQSSEQVCRRNQSTIEKIEQCAVNFAPIARLPENAESEEEKKPLISYFQDIPPGVKPLGKRYIKGKIEARFGKGTAEVVDNLEKFVSLQPPEEYENPWRYRAISVGVQYGVATAIAYSLPTGWAYGAMKTSDAVALHAERMKPMLKKMETEEEVNAWWKHQRDLMGNGDEYLESIRIAKGFVELSKVPSTCLKVIHNALVNVFSEIADKIGLTDRNVALIACSALEHIGKNSPEVLEEKVWSAAWIQQNQP